MAAGDRVAVVLGGRNLGGVILRRLGEEGYATCGIARSDETRTAIESAGAAAIAADASDPVQLRGALEEIRGRLGAAELIVNAISTAPPDPGASWGGGPIVDASPEALERWCGHTIRVALVFLAEGAKAMLAAGTAGTLVQVTNATARGPVAGQGMWSAGHVALRALVQTAAMELAPQGIRAATLIVDGPIESPKTVERMRAAGIRGDASLDQAAIADCVAQLAAQGPRGLSYELAITAAGRPWTP